jgi:hypothetical protein
MFTRIFSPTNISHIAIRSLQILLLKVALLLGVKFLPGVGYVKTDDSRHRAKPQSGLWQVVVAAQGKPDFVDYRDDDLAANIIVGADGENSLVAKDFEFERKVLQVRPTHSKESRCPTTHTVLCVCVWCVCGVCVCGVCMCCGVK